MPGPKAIRYFLQQDPELQAAGVAPPRSTATIWQVLRRHGRIPRRRRPAHEPVDLPPPLTSWQLDFKDVSTVPSDPLGKQQHVVEALNCVDCGTSLLVAADVRACLGKVVFETVIPRSVRLSEAPSHGKPVLEYEPTSRGATAYAELAQELIQRGLLRGMGDAG